MGSNTNLSSTGKRRMRPFVLPLVRCRGSDGRKWTCAGAHYSSTGSWRAPGVRDEAVWAGSEPACLSTLPRVCLHSLLFRACFLHSVCAVLGAQEEAKKRAKARSGAAVEAVEAGGVENEGAVEHREGDSRDPCAQGMLLLARMAQVVADQDKHGKKRALDGDGGGCSGSADSEQDSNDRDAIFRYLTPSDLRLTPEALISTKVSHFRCNLDGCQRDYRSHTALARHRKEKHDKWPKHTSHAADEACKLQAACKEGHCGSEHVCQSEEACTGALPHCHQGMQWPPAKNSTFQCPDDACSYAAGYVQSLRYHYLRTHGNQSRYSCEKCGKSFALKSDLNRHTSSCKDGLLCECGKMFHSVQGLSTHRRIFHREDGAPHGSGLGAAVEQKQDPEAGKNRGVVKDVGGSAGAAAATTSAATAAGAAGGAAAAMTWTADASSAGDGHARGQKRCEEEGTHADEQADGHPQTSHGHSHTPGYGHVDTHGHTHEHGHGHTCQGCCEVGL